LSDVAQRYQRPGLSTTHRARAFSWARPPPWPSVWTACWSTPRQCGDETRRELVRQSGGTWSAEATRAM